MAPFQPEPLPHGCLAICAMQSRECEASVMKALGPFFRVSPIRFVSPRELDLNFPMLHRAHPSAHGGWWSVDPFVRPGRYAAFNFDAFDTGAIEARRATEAFAAAVRVWRNW
ncbi:hypothetical protein [Aureimonas sp. AU4]|uniref:hypothetical protein n=1 Tax=Aureimonas sp. AU4 TaxID=1638163 RepID=UPI0012E3998A|nr:hypothetical protein [Aureimonas sp. AU4]